MCSGSIVSPPTRQALTPVAPPTSSHPHPWESKGSTSLPMPLSLYSSDTDLVKPEYLLISLSSWSLPLPLCPVWRLPLAGLCLSIDGKWPLQFIWTFSTFLFLQNTHTEYKEQEKNELRKYQLDKCYKKPPAVLENVQAGKTLTYNKLVSFSCSLYQKLQVTKTDFSVLDRLNIWPSASYFLFSKS